MRCTLPPEPADVAAPASVYAYTGARPFDPALPCVVFLHGALNDHSVWTLCARWFAHHGHSVLALDLPGHGRSGGAPLGSVAALAQWVLRVLDAAGATRAAVVGHSMGSLIALEAAARAPERISRLVMVATAYPMTVSRELLDTARDAPQVAIDRVNVYSHSGLAPKPSYPSPGNWLRGGNRALMRRMQAARTDVNLFHHDFGVCDAYADGLDAAQRVQCPAHLLLGSRDQMTAPRQAGELARTLKATVHRLDAAHVLMAEAPDQTLAALRRALA